MAKNTLKNKRNGFFQSGKQDITFLSFVLILLTIGLVMLFFGKLCLFFGVL